MDVYLNWRNLQGLNKAHTIIPNFAGVKGEKLAMGLPASTSAATAIYYFTPEIIAKFQAWLKANNYPLKGFMIWDSNWDIKNNFTISKAATEASNLEAKAIPA